MFPELDLDDHALPFLLCFRCDFGPRGRRWGSLALEPIAVVAKNADECAEETLDVVGGASTSLEELAAEVTRELRAVFARDLPFLGLIRLVTN